MKIVQICFHHIFLQKFREINGVSILQCKQFSRKTFESESKLFRQISLYLQINGNDQWRHTGGSYRGPGALAPPIIGSGTYFSKTQN